MNPYQSKNKSVIYNAFARLHRSEENAIHEGMYRFMDFGIAKLLQAHEDLHGGMAKRHPAENDTLGAAIFCDGQLIEAIGQGGGEFTPHGDAIGQLERLQAEAGPGWVGFVLSDMANNWYRVDWENDFLTYTLEEVESNFISLFKPITR